MAQARESLVQARPAARKIMTHQPGPASFRPAPSPACKISYKPGPAGNFFFLTMFWQQSQYDSRLRFSSRVLVMVMAMVRVRVRVRVRLRVRVRVSDRVMVRVMVRASG